VAYSETAKQAKFFFGSSGWKNLFLTTGTAMELVVVIYWVKNQ
jgi:hypothetical protein